MNFSLRYMKLVTFQKVNNKNFIHSLLNVFSSNKINMSLTINFEMRPSAAKPILTAFIGRMFFLSFKLIDCYWTHTHNHLVRKLTLNHLAKLAKRLTCVMSTYWYSVFDCMFLSCHICISESIHTL